MLNSIRRQMGGFISQTLSLQALCCLGLLLSEAACTAENPDAQLLPDPPPPPPPPPPETARYMQLRAARWPGGGRELTVGILNRATAAPFADELSSRVSVKPADGSPLVQKVQPLTLPPGYTAILLPPSATAMERAATIGAISSFVASRPVSERIALYRYGSSTQVFANFLSDRSELNEALQRYQNGSDGDANPLPLLQAIGPVVSDTENVGGGGPDVMRSVVVLTRDPKLVYVDYPQAYVMAINPNDMGLATASMAIDAARQRAFYKVATCAGEAKLSAKLGVSGLLGELETSLPATLPEELGAACSVDSIDSAKRAYTPVIEFVFDATQRAAHDARTRATQSGPNYDLVLAKSDFQTGIRLAPGQPTILATAHLRGQSSLSCARHGYTFQLEGSNRYLLPDSASDEFSLISMCDDPAYVYAPTVYTLLGDDLFNSKWRFVELIIDGRTQGIYILTEKTREELVRDTARATTVMRRQYPAAGKDTFEVLYSDNDDLLAPANRYQAFMTKIAPLSGNSLVSALREQMDYDQYLRYLANQSVLQSGDYIDEMFITGSEQADGLGATSEMYRFMAWDPEGYTACHSGGANAWVDANGMAYCAEARLDFKILPDAVVYSQFVTKLEESLANQLTRARMVAALDKVKTTLQGLLTRPEICAAMTELLRFNAGAADCAVARTVVGSRADAILAAYDARRTLLQTRIATYRAK